MNRFIILVILSLFSFHFSIGQTDLFDSLKVQLSLMEEDTNKYKFLIFLARKHSSIHYARQALAVSENIGYAPGKAAAHKHISGYYRDKGNYAEVISHWQQELNAYREMDDKYSEVTSLEGIAHIYQKNGLNSRALDYLYQAKNLAQELQDINPHFLLPTIYSRISEIYLQNEANYDSAMKYSLLQIPIYEEKKLV